MSMLWPSLFLIWAQPTLLDIVIRSKNACWCHTTSKQNWLVNFKILKGGKVVMDNNVARRLEWHYNLKMTIAKTMDGNSTRQIEPSMAQPEENPSRLSSRLNSSLILGDGPSYSRPVRLVNSSMAIKKKKGKTAKGQHSTIF